MSAYDVHEVQVTQYEVNANIYSTRRAALMAAVLDWCRDHGIGRGGEWDDVMVARAICEDPRELVGLLAMLVLETGEGR